MKIETEVSGGEVRGSWIAVGADCAEHLFVHCRSCGYTRQQERVLRVNNEDYAKLNVLTDLAMRADLQLAAIGLCTLLLSIGFLLNYGLMFPEYKLLILVGVGSVAVILAWAMTRRRSRNGEKRNAVRREILARYGAKIEDHFLTLPPKSKYD